MVFVLLAILMVVAVLRHQPDIDESQNLHLSYGWLEGKIPYRDRFDNHAPLLSMVSAPLAALAGETPHIVVFARLAQLPIAAAILGLIFLIARRVAGPEEARWTVLLCLIFADWSLKMIEFRPDVLWTFFWFLSLWLLVREIPCPRPRVFFIVGLCLGLALCTSIKTTFLAPALGLGCLVAWVASPDLRRTISWARAVFLASLTALGFLLPPLLLLGLFVGLGTQPEKIWFCLVEINRIPLEGVRVFAAAALMPCVILGGWWVCRREGGALRGILLIAAGSYLAALIGFAPEMRKQTFLPVTPLFVMVLCHAASLLRPLWLPRLAIASVLLGFGIHFLFESRLWKDGMSAQRELLADVIHHVDEDELILDGRGETIFAERSADLAFVEIVTRKINQQQLPQPRAERLAEDGTAITIGSLQGLPKSLRKFIHAHYLLAANGNLRAAGQHLDPEMTADSWTAQVELPLPGNYVIVRNGVILSSLRTESPGVHRVALGNSDQPAFLVWEEAWNEGFRPLLPSGSPP